MMLLFCFSSAYASDVGQNKSKSKLRAYQEKYFPDVDFVVSDNEIFPSSNGGKTLPKNGENAFPKNCFLKGQVRFGVKTYYTPGDRYYYEKILDKKKGDKWLCSEDKAIRSGWLPAPMNKFDRE